MIETRNILLIGRTGSGKSTIANVLINEFKENEPFAEIFKEGSGSTSQTYAIQEEKVEIDGIEYNLIDTIGIGDTETTEKQVLKKLKDKIHALEGGLSQILFVFKDKFTKENVEAYEYLYKQVFDEDEKALDYIAIVCTNFSGFRNENKECEEDKEKLLFGIGKVANIVKSCGGRVIYVDNPPLNDKRKAKLHLEDREDSRKILITHLKNCQEIYRPKEKKLGKRGTQWNISGGEFHDTFYAGDITAGNYASFGRVGVQNFKEVHSQYNYQGDSSKRKSFQGQSITINSPSLTAKQILEEIRKELQIQLAKAEEKAQQSQLNEKPLPLTPDESQAREQKKRASESLLVELKSRLSAELSKQVDNPAELLDLLLEVQIIVAKLQELPCTTSKQVSFAEEQLSKAKSAFLCLLNERSSKELSEFCRIQAEMTRLEDWKKKHLNNLKEKNTRITELEEQQTQIFHNPPKYS